MNELISRLVQDQQIASPNQVLHMVEHVARAPFAADLLEADEPLWGGFWQYDVIAPGYQLPAVELALLRAVRLDRHWPEDTTVERFLFDLRQATLNRAAGVWALSLLGQPCLVIAGPPDSIEESARGLSVRPLQPRSGPKRTVQGSELTTVVWYCASTGQLHAGYRVGAARFGIEGALEQRAPAFVGQPRQGRVMTTGWLAQGSVQLDLDNERSLAACLDIGILRWRRDASRMPGI